MLLFEFLAVREGTAAWPDVVNQKEWFSVTSSSSHIAAMHAVHLKGKGKPVGCVELQDSLIVIMSFTNLFVQLIGLFRHRFMSAQIVSQCAFHLKSKYYFNS